jgi:farnesol dehydrogenase
MKILVTGGTGFIGKNLVNRLVEAGHEVRALVRPTSDPSGFPKGVETAPGDVTDIDSLRAAMRGARAAYHLAALVKTWSPERSLFDRVNVGGLRNVIEAAREARVDRLIYTSSFMALGPTDGRVADESQQHAEGSYCNDYERTKALADRLARQAAAEGAPLVLLYPGVVYGPGEMTDGNIVVKMIRDHLRGRLPGVVGPGDRRWSYAFVEDVLAGHLAALDKGRLGERYLLAGENATNNELFQLVAELTGKPAPRLHIPYALASLLGRAALAFAWVTRIPPLLTHEVVDVFRHEWAYSSEKAERELGYRATPLREGLSRTLAWMKETRLVA